MEQNVALDPGDVGGFGADGVMLEADGVTDLVQELFGAGFHL